MPNHKKTHNIVGWIVFSISLIIYTFTLEPSVSFWDCGEFIASSHKLQISHPPGAPFYQLILRVFSLVAGNSQLTAFATNWFSALAAAFTVMVLFNTIVLLLQRIPGNKIRTKLTIAAASIGALSFAFTDTFWFSAVETEVYTFSLLFTALIFWAILQWDKHSNTHHATKWILLIAYLIGLSIGVHLLNLLAVPAIALLWYFKKYKTSVWGALLTLLCSGFLVLIIMFGIIQGTPILAQKAEIFFVNKLQMPVNSGLIAIVLIIALLSSLLIVYSHKRKKIWLNTIILSFTFIYIGFATYSMVIIRSAANPPMNENNPSNAYALGKYLNRDQYGKNPLIYGKYYNAPAVDLKKGEKIYYLNNNTYIETHSSEKYVYDNNFKTFFPRMYSSRPNHVIAYKNWGNIKGKAINIERHSVYKPTFAENFRFFLNYQLNHMYLRYFMWNFSGRQNDIQGHGDILHGNWLTGYGFIDKVRLGHNGVQPQGMSNPKTTNRYFMLPLLLGIMGMMFQAQKAKKDFLVVLCLFFMTGIAIIIYLNQTPFQPRERDYAYLGSFYSFAIWIGIGTIFIANVAKKISKKYSFAITLFLTANIPLILLAQNFNDHNRSNRFFVRDMAKNYLKTCDKNAILFTYGDNDTFPLWYVQDVENFRTDVRVCNITLLNSYWYINQMKEKKYDSDPLPITREKQKYQSPQRDIILVQNYTNEYIELKKALDMVMSDHSDTKIESNNKIFYDYFSGKRIKITVNKNNVIKSGTVAAKMKEQIVDSIIINLNTEYITKSDLIILEILANNDWERPVYFDSSVLQMSSIRLSDYLRNDGFAYRFVPIRKTNQSELIDTNILYSNLIEKYTWGNIQNPNIYIDNNIYQNIELLNVKQNFTLLAKKLLNEGNTQKAIYVIDSLYKILPCNIFPPKENDINIAKIYYRLNCYQKADSLLAIIAKNNFQNLNFFQSLKPHYANLCKQSIDREITINKKIHQTIKAENRTKLQNEFDELFLHARINWQQ